MTVYKHGIIKDSLGNMIPNYRISMTSLGNYKERDNYWNRLNNINKSVYTGKMSFQNRKYWNLYNCFKSYSNNNGFSFSNRFLHELTEFSLKIYIKLKCQNLRKFTSEKYLCFLTLYISLTLKGKFISLKKLALEFDLNNDYKKILSDFLFYFKDIQSKLRNDNLRIKIIINSVLDYVNFDLCYSFIRNNWNVLKISKNSTLISVLLYQFLIPNGKSLHKIHKELNVNMSNGKNCIKLLRKRGLDL